MPSAGSRVLAQQDPTGDLTDMDQNGSPMAPEIRIGYDGMLVCGGSGLSCYCRSMYLAFPLSPSKKEGKRKGRKSQEILSSRFFVHGGYY